MNIAFDIDGVLTDFETFLNVFGTKYLKCKKDNLIPSSIVGERFGCTEKQERKFYKKYLFWYSKHFPVRENAAGIIRELKQKGHKVYIISARALSDRKDILGSIMRHIVVKWLKKNGIVFDDIYFVSLKNSAIEKRDICQMKKIDIMVEDDPINIESIAEACRVICLDADYNRNLQVTCMRANDMNDVYSLVQYQRVFGRESIAKMDKMPAAKKVSYVNKIYNQYLNTPYDKETILGYKRKQKKWIFIFGWLILLLTRIDVKGYENIPADENVIFVSNHKRALDIPLLYIVLRKRMLRFLAKQECQFSVGGGIQREIGTIFVKREDKKSCKTAISVIIHNLVHGGDIVIFPEGTRNRTEQLLLPFKKGAVLAAQVTGKAIVPIVIKKQGRRCRVNIGKQINVTATSHIEEENSNLREKMMELIQQLKK